MRTVMGLLPYKQDITQEMTQIENAGFDRNNIRVVTNNGSIKKLLGCEPNCIVAKYATWGAILGIVVYGVFISVAVWCDCVIYPISHTIAFEIIPAGILVGALIGGFLGIFVGLAEYEKDTHLFTQGINIGDKVFVLHAEGVERDKAIKTLCQIGCIGVRMLPE